MSLARWRRACPGSIARVADDEIARERQPEETVQQQRLDRERLDDPFGKLPMRGNGSVKPASHGREPIGASA